MDPKPVSTRDLADPAQSEVPEVTGTRYGDLPDVGDSITHGGMEFVVTQVHMNKRTAGEDRWTIGYSITGWHGNPSPDESPFL